MRTLSYFSVYLLIGAFGAPLLGNLYEPEVNYATLPLRRQSG
jgi:hypothetical protein